MGKKSSKSKTTTTPWGPAQPYILGAMNTVNGIVQGNQGNLNEIAGDVRSTLPGLKDMAFGSNPAVDAGFKYAGDVMGGKYLGQGNPYMQGMINDTANDVGNRVNSTFSMAGRTGGGNNVQRLGQGLASAENQLRYQDYASERDRMMQAAGMLPALSNSQYAGVTPYLAAAQLAGTLPYAGASSLSPILAMGAGAGTSSTTQSNGGGLLGSLLGAGATLGSALITKSDRRLKKDIVKVGEASDGLGIYEWTYRNDPDAARYRGVMADEVKDLRPLAYVPNWKGDGFDAVNYAMLGSVE